MANCIYFALLGTLCVLQIRPRDTLGPSSKIICLAIIQTSHDTCQPVLDRTVRYGTVQFKQRTVNGNICPKRESNLRPHRLTL